MLGDKGRLQNTMLNVKLFQLKNRTHSYYPLAIDLEIEKYEYLSFLLYTL